MIDARGYSRSKILSRAVEAYLIQILNNGFLHADPHPGNLAIDENEALIYYDFGMMVEIKSFTKERLLKLFYACFEKDAKKAVEILIDLQVLRPSASVDMLLLRRYMLFFLNNLHSQKPDQQQTLAAISEDIFATAADLQILFPSSAIFIMKAFLTLEGIGYTLDPDFSFLKIAAAHAQELLVVRSKQHTGMRLLDEIRKQTDDARTNIISMPYSVQQIEQFLKQLETGDMKLRVRVLESERSCLKAIILQTATMYTVLCGTLLNLGVMLSSQGSQIIANGSFIGAGLFLTLFIGSMQRVKRLDKFNKMI